MVMKLFKERQLKVLEEDMLKAITVRADSGLPTGLGGKRFMSVYGHRDRFVSELVKKVPPQKQQASASRFQTGGHLLDFMCKLLGT